MRTFIYSFISTTLFAALPASAALTSQIHDSRTPMANGDVIQKKREALKKMEITGAVIYTTNSKGQLQPKCVINTVGRQDLVPAFAIAAAEGTNISAEQSTLSQIIGACSSQEEAIVLRTAQASVLEGSKVGFAHLIVACAIGAAAGTYFDSPLAAGGSSGGSSFIMSGFWDYGSSLGPAFGWSIGPAMGGLVSGAVVGLLCHAATNYIIQYTVK